MSYKKILIAVDSGDNALKAAKSGMELAQKLNAEPALIFVVNVSKSKGNPDAGVSESEALLIAKKEGEQTLDGLAAVYWEKKIIKFMPTGHPGIEIIKAAMTWEADVIVMGIHRKSGILGLWEGSVTGYILNHSEIPVLMVPFRKMT